MSEVKDEGKQIPRRRRKKKPVKKRPPKNPNKLVKIHNADKESGNWYEKWNVPKNRSLGNYIHPYRMILSAGTGVGKTLTAKNVILQAQSTHRPFKKVIVCTC